MLKAGGALCTALGVSVSVSPSLYPVDELSARLLTDDSRLEAFTRFVFTVTPGEWSPRFVRVLGTGLPQELSWDSELLTLICDS